MYMNTRGYFIAIFFVMRSQKESDSMCRMIVALNKRLLLRAERIPKNFIIRFLRVPDEYSKHKNVVNYQKTL